MSKPFIITQGDPAGVGPELALRALHEHPNLDLRIIGCHAWLKKTSELLKLPFHPDRIIDLPLHHPIRFGELSAPAGQHSFACLDAAVEGALAGNYAAVITNPIHKEAWHLAEVPYPAHTEYLAEKTGTTSHAMMLTSPEITCSLVTTHVPLSQVPSLLHPDRILEVIRLTHDTMSRVKGRPARLTMPGLNPHAGEGGLFGREEIEILNPVITQARQEGIALEGPISPDTAFRPYERERTDAYICLYHDQGLIPLKTLAFDLGVNVTLGLPIIRTSVDHGTAFDIAGRGTASVTSLNEAIRFAHRAALGT